MISCEKATEYCQRNEESKLNLAQRFQLWFHLAMCGICKACSKQSLWIADVSRRIKIDDAFTESEKEDLKRSLDTDVNLK